MMRVLEISNRAAISIHQGLADADAGFDVPGVTAEIHENVPAAGVQRHQRDRRPLGQAPSQLKVPPRR